MNISKLISVFSLLLSIGFTRGYLRGSRALSSSGTTATIKLLGGNGVLRRNRKLRPIDIPLDFEIGLDIKPTTGIVQGWSNILHFTATNTNCCGYGSRIPGVWFRPGNRELFIADGHTANGKSHSGQWGCKDKVLKLVPGQNYRLKMVFKRKTVSVFVNDAVACNNIPRKDRKVFKNVHVYVADPWHEAAKASIKNLYFKALPAQEPCPCLARYDPVCGKDGHTYSNACKADCAGVEHINGACQNPRRITCPVVGMLIKNGDLVPSIDSAGLPFITKKQTKLAMLKRGVSMAIATKSTDGNFNSDACPTCPETMNPFEMNIIEDGNSRDNEAGKPHEHFRSTGIRDNDAGRPDKDLYAEAEQRLFGGNKWMQWSPTKVRDLANLFDRSPDKCKEGVAKSTISQHLLCSNDQADNIAPETFAGSLQNMIKEFHDPSTGLITQDKFRAMWLNNEFPSYTACEDQTLADGSAWFDARGPRFNCAWYAEDPDRCSTRAGGEGRVHGEHCLLRVRWWGG